MAFYTVHLPKLAASPEAAQVACVFVRDGWSWGAFFFGPFWLLWHRHWLVGLAVLVLEAVLLGGLDRLPMAPVAGAVAHVIVSLLFGFEGASLRRLALEKAGFGEVAMLAGGNRDDIERRFFAEMPQVVRNLASASGVPQVGPRSVIGLFPEARVP